jgi:uncharacterized membrane protein
MSSLAGFWAFIRLEGIAHPWLWVSGMVAGGALLLATYRGIFLRSKRALTWVLMGLRGLGILTLVLALAKPTWTRELEQVEPGRVAVILDDSASMTLPDANGTVRYKAALAASQRLRHDIASDGSGTRMVVELFDLRADPLLAAPNKPSAGRTDLIQAVSGVAARMRSEPLAALVVISDGADNTGRKDFRDVGELAAPVYALGFEPAASTLDLAVGSVRAPERAMVHNAIKVEVHVVKTGGPRTSANLSIKRGRDELATQRVDLSAGNEERTVTLNITPDQPGRFVLTAAVALDAGENALGNNAANFPLRVDAEPVRVLYLEGFLRYEYKYLKNCLEDDPDVSLLSIVRRANPERSETTPSTERLTPGSLKAIDVVILGDMESSFLRPSECQALVSWLEEKGHALLVLGGYHSFGPDGIRATPLADVLPVVFADQPPFQSEEPFQLDLTEEGQRHPVFEVSGDRVRDAATWSGAPSLTGLSLVREAKPGATVLATDPNVQVGGKPAIAAAVHRFGAGHVMVLTVDTTWRWSRLTRVAGGTDTLFARFWSQAIRWLAGRARDEGRPVLVVSTDQPTYEVGHPVRIRVARDLAAGRDLAAATLAVEVQGPSGPPVAVPVHSGSAEPEVATGTLTPSASGVYTTVATLSAAGKTVANQPAEFLVQGSDLELADPRTVPENLRVLAAATGGSYFDVSDAGRLAAKIERKDRRTVRLERSEFWNSPLLFLGFLFAVTGEWLLRRKFHLI